MERRALVPIEVSALKAAVLPMLIRERREVMSQVIRTALRGMFQPGLICDRGVRVARRRSAFFWYVFLNKEDKRVQSIFVKCKGIR